MTKLGKQASAPNINGVAYKFKPLRHGRVNLSGDSTSSPINITTGGENILIGGLTGDSLTTGQYNTNWLEKNISNFH